MSDTPGPTGLHPDGKISSADDGETNVEFSHSPELGLVRMNFGTPTVWIAMGRTEVLGMVRLLLAHTAALSDDPDEALLELIADIVKAAEAMDG